MLNQLYEQYCANRLPCGICRLTNSMCPKCPATIDITTCTCTATSPNKINTTTTSSNMEVTV